MNTRVPIAPVRQSIVVEAPIERAFRVFTEEFGSLKPPEHNLLSVPIAETVFEPRVGGHVCQSARKFDPVSASNFGSDSLLMQFEGCLAF
jgi:hypothetical protein